MSSEEWFYSFFFISKWIFCLIFFKFRIYVFVFTAKMPLNSLLSEFFQKLVRSLPNFRLETHIWFLLLFQSMLKNFQLSMFLKNPQNHPLFHSLLFWILVAWRTASNFFHLVSDVSFSYLYVWNLLQSSISAFPWVLGLGSQRSYQYWFFYYFFLSISEEKYLYVTCTVTL